MNWIKSGDWSKESRSYVSENQLRKLYGNQRTSIAVSGNKARTDHRVNKIRLLNAISSSFFQKKKKRRKRRRRRADGQSQCWRPWVSAVTSVGGRSASLLLLLRAVDESLIQYWNELSDDVNDALLTLRIGPLDWKEYTPHCILGINILIKLRLIESRLAGKNNNKTRGRIFGYVLESINNRQLHTMAKKELRATDVWEVVHSFSSKEKK